MSRIESISHETLKLLLRPVIRFCFRRAVSYQALTNAARAAYVEVVAEHLRSNGSKVSVSAISAFTGIHRKAIAPLLNNESSEDPHFNFAMRVMGQWKNDRRFCDKSGRPRVLDCEGQDSEFNRLVRTVSSDLYAKSMLTALRNAGAIEFTKSGVRLKSIAFKPSSDEMEEIKVMATDCDHLLGAISENIETSGTRPNYHATTIFDNLPKEEMPKIKRWVFTQCVEFQSRIEKYLSQRDLDIKPQRTKTGGGRFVVGLFTRN